MIRRKAHDLTRLAAFGASDREDLEQELALELFRKHPRFDPSRGSEAAFVACVIKCKAHSILRFRLAKKRDIRRNGQSLNAPITSTDGDVAELGKSITSDFLKRHTGQAPHQAEELAKLCLDVRELIGQLPDDLRRLAALLQEMTPNEVSRELGRSRRQVAKEISRLRKRFEDAQLQEYM